jgi:Ca2+-binding RTX toxin-like protein
MTITGHFNDPVNNAVELINFNGSTFGGLNLGTGDYNLVAAAAGVTTLNGGAGNDALFGTTADDTLNGNGGNDVMSGSSGNDTLIGGAGTDTLNGGAGDDLLNAGFGVDQITGGDGSDTLDYSWFNGGLWVNLAIGELSDIGNPVAAEHFTSVENYLGGAGGDMIVGSNVANRLDGGGGNDTLIGGDGNDTLNGGAGDDLLNAGFGVDQINGGDGSDTLDYSWFNGGLWVNLETGGLSDIGNPVAVENFTSVENYLGGAGGDMIVGSNVANRLDGGAGNDTLSGMGGNDTLIGGDGNDILDGGAGDDLINGGYGVDQITGGDGNDTLDYSWFNGGLWVNLDTGELSDIGNPVAAEHFSGIENVRTGAGADTITASNAVNVMDGGAGNDTFKFLTTAAANGDTILGFAPGDRLDLSAIDANTGTAANDAFTLITGAEFTAAGQLAVSFESRADGDFTVIQGNIDGNLTADFRIEIGGNHTISNANLIP